jgi:hypothetical protein
MRVAGYLVLQPALVLLVQQRGLLLLHEQTETNQLQKGKKNQPILLFARSWSQTTTTNRYTTQTAHLLFMILEPNHLKPGDR